jgi:hypothetical protein
LEKRSEASTKIGLAFHITRNAYLKGSWATERYILVYFTELVGKGWRSQAVAKLPACNVQAFAKRTHNKAMGVQCWAAEHSLVGDAIQHQMLIHFIGYDVNTVFAYELLQFD